ncbi:hypothetical protein EJ04DRAFT_475754 [Polyplosphaeria fusca]|uniref:Uncharacterized protein n=1 Tax=Polyplosphaeria fusca TaxID=682080 RepID=A0A9P4QR80_9PLEO|nr:hypothetical protein EJ04DRAFT_475754 [Polyplosphaeria fusca]
MAQERHAKQDADYQPLYIQDQVDDHQRQHQHGDFPRPEQTKNPIASTEYLSSSQLSYSEPYTPAHYPRSQKSSSIFSATGYLLFLVVVSTLLFVFTSWFVQAAFSGEVGVRVSQAFGKLLKWEVGDALAVLRVSQGVLSACTTLALMNAFELLQWALASRDRGISVPSFLGLSPTTAPWGVAMIALSKASRLPERLWGLIRVALLAAIWLAGIVIFVRASVMTAYDTGYTYDVTAGVGQFNGSYVPRYLEKIKAVEPSYRFQIVPSTILAWSYSLVWNSLHVISGTPIDCKDCDAYLLTGGVIMTTPWLPEGYDRYPLVNIDKAPATQVQFKRGMDSSDGFTDENCSTYGSSGNITLGMKVCINKSKASPGSYVAGLYVCSNGTANNACSQPGSLPNLTTTMSVYGLSAAAISARSNFSIMSAQQSHLSILNPNIDLEGYKAALDWILDFNATNLPPTSAIAEHFWNAQDQISSPYWSSELTRTFQSLLTFPLWFFNPNNYGNPDLEVRDVVQNLPPQHYVKASLTRPFTKIVLDKGMFVAFAVLEGLSILFIWALLIWLWITKPRLPQITSYPLVDFAFKAKEPGYTGEGFGPRRAGIYEADGQELRRRMRDVRVTLRRDEGASM